MLSGSYISLYCGSNLQSWSIVLLLHGTADQLQKCNRGECFWHSNCLLFTWWCYRRFWDALYFLFYQ